MSKQSIFGRIAQLAKANINAMIDSAEDPQKMLDQMVRDYTENIREAESAVAQTIGNLRLLEKDHAEDVQEAADDAKLPVQVERDALYPGLTRVLTTKDGQPLTVSYGTSDNLDAMDQGHTGTQLRVAAYGPSAANVVGLTDQTDLFFTISRALGLPSS